MVDLRWVRPVVIIAVMLLVGMFAATACGGDDVEVTREVVKDVEVTREVIKEVPVTQIVEKVVTKEVVMEKIVVQTPTPIAMAMVQKTPDWVQLGKAGGGILDFLNSSNPGDWDMHRVGSFATILPSSPRFNQLIEYDPHGLQQDPGGLGQGLDRL